MAVPKAVTGMLRRSVNFRSTRSGLHFRIAARFVNKCESGHGAVHSYAQFTLFYFQAVEAPARLISKNPDSTFQRRC